MLPILAKTDGSNMGNLPIIMMGVYLLMLAGVGVYGYIKSKSTEEDYYLAGRKQGFLITSLTIIAAFFSSAALLGNPGAVYKDGVAFMLFALNLPVGGATVYIFGNRIWLAGHAKGYVTPGDMISEYYDNSVMVRILVAVLGFLYVLPYVVIQIRAGGHLAQQIFSSTPYFTILGLKFEIFDVGATVLSIIMMIYIIVGGMRSVALADVFQGIILLAGMLIAGVVAIIAFGGVTKYFNAISTLPPEALSLPGASGRYTPWLLMTLCIFGSLASIIQPAQWMRFYAAKSLQTLRRSALTFSLILPPCFLFGVMLVTLGARVLYPPTTTVDPVTHTITVIAHPVVGSHDQALIALLKNQGVAVMGTLGPFIVMLIMLAVVAASMSTADANLHALSAVLTRDLYDRFIHPKAGEKERTWIGRGIIVLGTLLSLWLVYVGQRNKDFAPLKMIVEMQFVAMAFSCQVLPAAVDVLFVHRGTRAGAVCGMVSGLLVVMMFTPMSKVLLGQGLGISVANTSLYLKQLLDIGFCGLVANVPVFVAVSLFTKKPDQKKVAELKRIMTGEND